MSLKEDQIKKKLFINGLDSFKNSKFYDAHEYWEELWSDYYLEDAKFIQALIQLSVGYFHITNNNKNGAIGLLVKCRGKFELYKPVCRKINIEYILKCVNNSIECLNNINEMKNFNWKLVPNFDIDD
tara:strand:+ start:480 stop:860 length:381 start_codon:yes stop_codon:yes gene_type:complete